MFIMLPCVVFPRMSRIHSLLFALGCICLLSSPHTARSALLRHVGDTLTRAEKIAAWQAINRDVWQPFSDAYSKSNVGQYLGLHSADFLRVGDGRILKKPEFMIEQRITFKRWRERSINLTISFRFTERIASRSHASERGVFCTTALFKDDKTGAMKEERYYGQFHVLLRKERTSWKLTMDYDSDENGTINEQSFNQAHALDAFEKY
jgi:hypothetical protein